VRLYREALAHAVRMRDSDSASLLESILGDELAHVQEIDGLLTQRNGND
jgi:bacterioferritin